jgi:hypothetical protein
MKKLRKILALAFVLLLLISLASCGSMETERGNEIKAQCETMIDAFIAGDEDAAYAVFADGMDRNSFSQSFLTFCDYVEGVETYELTQIGWYAGMENGVGYYRATFDMTSNAGNFTIEAMEVEGYEGIYNFRIVSDEDYENATENYTGTITKMKGASPIQWGFIVFSALCLGFVIWMLADCIKRKIKYKVIWIILILCGALAFTVNVGQNGANFNSTIAIMIFSYSYLQIYAAGASVLKITWPIGAIVYLILRKKFTAQEIAAENAETAVIAEAAAVTETAEIAEAAKATDTDAVEETEERSNTEE